MIYKEWHFFLYETISYNKKWSLTLAEKLKTLRTLLRLKKEDKKNRITLTQIPGFSLRSIFGSPHPLSKLNVST